MHKRIKIFPLLLIPLTLILSCRKHYDPFHGKPKWIREYFEELQSGNYPDIYAISWWNEDFDRTYLTINSSKRSLKSYREGVSDERYISESYFLNHKLQPVAGKVYHGAFPGFGGTEDEVSQNSIENFEVLSQKRIAWSYFSNNWYDSLIFPKNSVDIIGQYGCTPFIRIMFRSDFETVPDPYLKLQNIIDGMYDLQLKEWANCARDCGYDLLAEFGTEVNGNWFSWNGQFNGGGTTNGYGDPTYPDGPERFRDAYRHIIDICNQCNAVNITWFFHFDVSGEPEEDWNDAVYYYPGDSYIDWIGVSTYGPQQRGDDYISPNELLQNAYLKMQQISVSKPYAILEFGITEL